MHIGSVQECHLRGHAQLDYAIERLQETWAAMEAVVDKGLVRSIGVSNFSPEKIKAWLSSSRVPVSVNQVKGYSLAFGG